MTEDDVSQLKIGDELHMPGAEGCLTYTVLQVEGAILARSSDNHLVRLDLAGKTSTRDQFHLPADCPTTAQAR